MDVIRKESQLITDYLTKTGEDSDFSSDSDSDDEKRKSKKNRQSKKSWNFGSILKNRTSEFEERNYTRQSLRQSLAGCEVNKRLVNKFGSIKAVLSENERIERSGIFVIHPYSNFRFAWDMLTLVMLLLNVIFIPVFMAFPAFEFNSRQKIEDQSTAKIALYFRWDSVWVLAANVPFQADIRHMVLVGRCTKLSNRNHWRWFASSDHYRCSWNSAEIPPRLVYSRPYFNLSLRYCSYFLLGGDK